MSNIQTSSRTISNGDSCSAAQSENPGYETEITKDRKNKNNSQHTNVATIVDPQPTISGRRSHPHHAGETAVENTHPTDNKSTCGARKSPVCGLSCASGTPSRRASTFNFADSSEDDVSSEHQTSHESTSSATAVALCGQRQASSSTSDIEMRAARRG